MKPALSQRTSKNPANQSFCLEINLFLVPRPRRLRETGNRSIRGYVSKETVVLRRWGVLQDNLIFN